MHDVPSLAQLIKALQQVPYLASKNVYRVAHYFLHLEPAKLEQFCTMLQEAKKNVVLCDMCCAWKERTKVCTWCTTTKREQSLVCVIETWEELLAIEKTGGYHGVYHVLGGVISPLEGIGPDQLHIAALIRRVEKGDVKEIILATNQTPEGEATSSYIAHKLKHTGVTITCLARGMPIGSKLGMMDRVTVYKALSERRPF